MSAPGGCVDTYVLTRDRTRATVDRYLDRYVDVAASEDRGDEELMMVPLGYDGPTNTLREWEWQPAGTLSAVIELMLSQPYRAFAIYLTPKDPEMCRSILAGTRDGALVFGLSVYLGNPDEWDQVMARARAVLTELRQTVGGSTGMIVGEEPPPLDSDEFHTAKRVLWKDDEVVHVQDLTE